MNPHFADNDSTERIHRFQGVLKSWFDQRFLEKSPLIQSMHYSLFSTGKRIRPALVYETADRLGLSTALADPVAMSIEMIHAFSLIHDDLPCMDNDDYRRGQPTNHRVFGEPVALLAGDALLTHAFEVFSALALMTNPNCFQTAFQQLTHAVGAHGIMVGQAKELSLGQNPTLDQLQQIHFLKTTSLFEASILIPVILCGISKDDPIYSDHQEFAKSFGAAFQIWDDLQDHAQDTKTGQESKNLRAFFSTETLKKIALDGLVPVADRLNSKIGQDLARQITDI